MARSLLVKNSFFVLLGIGLGSSLIPTSGLANGSRRPPGRGFVPPPPGYPPGPPSEPGYPPAPPDSGPDPVERPNNGRRTRRRPSRPRVPPNNPRVPWAPSRPAPETPASREPGFLIHSSVVREDFSVTDASGRPVAIHKPRQVATPAPGDAQDPNAVITGVTPRPEAQALCGDPDVSDEAKMAVQSQARQVLFDIVLRLEGAPLPRALITTEQEKLAGVPLCEPYLPQLRQITTLLRDPASPGSVLIEDSGTRFESMSVSNVRVYGRAGAPAGEQGFVEVRASGVTAGFFVGAPFPTSSEGYPLYLEQYEVVASPASGGIGLRFALKNRSVQSCRSRYNLEFRNVAGQVLSEIEFTVFEGRCGR